MCASFSDDDVGKTVVNASGEEVGMVTAVEHGTARVKADPGIVDSIRATLGWEGTTEGTYPLQEEAIDRITHDEVRLTGDIDGEASGGTVEPERTETGGSRSEAGSVNEPRHEPVRRDESESMDPARDERTDAGERRYEGSETMDPDVGDGDRIGDPDDADISDRDRRSRDRDSDDDSDRS